MREKDKSRDELTREPEQLRQRVAELEARQPGLAGEPDHALRLTQFAVDGSADGVFWMAPDSRLIYVNHSACRTLGYSRDELLGKHYLEFIVPEYRDQVARFYGIQFVKRTPKTYYECPVLTKQGETIWVGQNTQLIVKEDTVVGFQSIARDITDRKRAEEALRKSEQKYRNVIQAMQEGYYETDLFTAVLQPGDTAICHAPTDGGRVSQNVPRPLVRCSKGGAVPRRRRLANTSLFAQRHDRQFPGQWSISGCIRVGSTGNRTRNDAVHGRVSEAQERARAVCKWASSYATMSRGSRFLQTSPVRKPEAKLTHIEDFQTNQWWADDARITYPHCRR